MKIVVAFVSAIPSAKPHTYQHVSIGLAPILLHRFLCASVFGPCSITASAHVNREENMWHALPLGLMPPSEVREIDVIVGDTSMDQVEKTRLLLLDQMKK